jgi:hypothetical protein
MPRDGGFPAESPLANRLANRRVAIAWRWRWPREPAGTSRLENTGFSANAARFLPGVHRAWPRRLHFRESAKNGTV